MLVQIFTFDVLSFEGYVYDDGDTEAILTDILAHYSVPVFGGVVTLSGGPRRLAESYAIEKGVPVKIPFKCANIRERILVQSHQNRHRVDNRIRRATFGGRVKT